MAYALIQKLQALKHDELLMKLSEACSVIEKSKGQKHKVFEPSFDAKPIYSDKFLNQKLDYIHRNPISGKWNLCSNITDYYHSSAAFYELSSVHNEVDIVLIIVNTDEHRGLQGPLRETLRGRENILK